MPHPDILLFKLAKQIVGAIAIGVMASAVVSLFPPTARCCFVPFPGARFFFGANTQTKYMHPGGREGTRAKDIRSKSSGSRQDGRRVESSVRVSNVCGVQHHMTDGTIGQVPVNAAKPTANQIRSLCFFFFCEAESGMGLRDSLGFPCRRSPSPKYNDLVFLGPRGTPKQICTHGPGKTR